MARIGRTFGGVLVFSVLGVASGQALGDDDQVLEERLAEFARRQDGECFLQLAAFEEAAAAFEERSARATSGEERDGRCPRSS